MSNFSINARTRVTDKKAKEHPVKVVYRCNGKITEISTGVSVAPKSWDAKARKIRPVTGHPTHIADNDVILAVVSDLTAIARKRAVLGADLSPKAVKGEYDALKGKTIFVKTDHLANDELLTYWLTYVSNKVKSGDYTESTAAVYFQGRNHIVAYDPTVTWQSINVDWLIGFKGYSIAQGHGPNQWAKTVKSLKSILNAGLDADKHSNINHKKKAFRVSFEVAESEIALTSNEVEMIAKANFAANDRLSNARDLFLLHVWTGASNADILKMGPHILDTDNGGFIIDYRRIKTGVTASIPVHRNIRHIATLDAATWPRMLSNQKMNKYIKEVASLAGLEEDRAAKVVTTSGRRTFVTYMLGAGISPELIRGMTGHKTEKAFAGYSRYGAKEKARTTAKLLEFQ